MSHWPSARHSSGVEPYGSTTSLPANAASFGGHDTGTMVSTNEKAQQEGPAAKVPFYKRRSFIICQVIFWIINIVMIFVLLWPVVRAIAQHVLDVSEMHVESSMIQNPSNESFTLVMKGYVSNTGPIPAVIHWNEPVRVTWMRDYAQDNETQIPIGVMWLDSLSASGGQATIDQTTQFNITDQEAFGEFTKTMITKQQFTWRLNSENIAVNALQFPQATGLHFQKDLTLQGINSFAGGVVLKNFLLPGTDANGGIKFSTTTTLTNQSPFTVDLGTVAFDLQFDGVNLGRGTSQGVVVKPGENDVTLAGVMVTHTAASDLDKIGKLFTAYLNGDATPVVARGVSTTQSNGQNIGWLSAGITALELQVPLKSPNPINAIQSISIGYLNLTFTQDTQWAPMTTTDDLQAKLSVPFGFGMEVTSISNSFSIIQNNVSVGALSSPLAPATSDIRTTSSSLTQGTIDITLSESPLQVPGNAHDQFSSFNADLTQHENIKFQLVGHAKTIAKLPIGTVTLDPIKFNVTSQLAGLRGLNGYTWVQGVDVMGGTTDHLNLAIDVLITNPSAVNLKAGDLTLQLYSGDALLGTALMPALHLVQGNNTIAATSEFRPNDTPEGVNTLTKFLAGEDTTMKIKGYDSSTTIMSLLPAFKTMNIDATLPGLKSKLLDSAKLTVLPTTGHGDNIAHTQVTLNDPFTSGFTVKSVDSTVEYHGISMGKIQQSTNFAVAGKQATTSPDLNFDLNLDPATMFTVLRLLAGEAGLSTDQIDGLVQLGGYQYVQPVTKRELVPRSIYTGFDLPSFVDKAFSVLKADITLKSDVSIGDYATALNYVQKGVPIKTDETLHLILPVLAQPIVQKIVGASVMGIESIVISNPQETSFETALKGSITQAGPFDAKISFPEGLMIYWNGQQLGRLAMSDVSLVADVGATLDTSGSFAVSSGDQLAAFTKVMLQEASFDWEIRGENLVVSAMGISVPGISITKTVTLKGMNGLKGAVTVNSFDLPQDDPEGGITLTLDTTIVNPSQVGISLNSLSFGSYYSTGTYLGPVSSVPQTSLAPLSTSQVKFKGRLVPQTTEAGLADLSKIFTDFIHNIPSNVEVRGVGADPAVSWLVPGVQTLNIASVLPARGVIDIIKSITINQMSMDFPAGSAYAPISSSTDTTAKFDLPFGFNLNIVSLDQTIIASYQNNKFAQLALGTIPANTDVASRIIHLTFQNVPFAVVSGQEGTFQSFLAATTLSDTVSFGLSGTASSQAETAIGRLSITGIDFNVQSNLKAINTFGGTAAISDVHIAGSGGAGGNEYVSSPLKTTLNNPSNIALKAGKISLPTYYQGVQLGESVVADFNLVPGSTTLDAEFRYHPADANDTVAQSFLQAFVEQSGSIPITIHGNGQSASFDSLRPALEQTGLSSGVPGIGASLVKSVTMYPVLVPIGVEVEVEIYNPFDTSLQLLHVQSDSGLDGDTFAQFTWIPDGGFTIPAKSTKTSERIKGVHLVGDFAAILKALVKIATRKVLDVRIAQTGRIGDNGYEIPWLKYNQNSVPVNIDINLGALVGLR